MIPGSNLPAWLQAPIPIDASEPAWLTTFRERHHAAFQKYGLPSQKSERWKYTDLSFLNAKQWVAPVEKSKLAQDSIIESSGLSKEKSTLIVLVNGSFAAHLSDIAVLPEGLIICDMRVAISKYPEIVKNNWPSNIDVTKHPFAALNAAIAQEGVFIYLNKNQVLNNPIHILSITSAETICVTQQHNLVVLSENSHMTILEESLSITDHACLTNKATHIRLGMNANLNYTKVQREGSQAVHLSSIFVKQEENSYSAFTFFSLGGLFSRDDVCVKLQGAGADCRTAGFYNLSQDNQYIDYHIDIDHEMPRSHSEMLFKGIVDKKSRAVFNGRLHVKKDAQKIVAYQGNHNLLLSKDAEVYSKPELEIYADDVKCKHGATTGQLDQDALFYMRSRGIEYKEAMNILLRGFAEEIIDRVTMPVINNRVKEYLNEGTSPTCGRGRGALARIYPRA